MNENENAELTEMQVVIKNYPYLRECFSEYLRWLFENCDEDRRKYDVVYVKIKTGATTLGDLENTFREFGNILELSEREFCKAFRFDIDKNKKEILKIGDLLAEPWSAFALHKYGFESIRKIPSSNSKSSDFIASYNSGKFAIEIKNLRSEVVENYYIWQTNALYNNQSIVLSDHFVNSPGQLHVREQELLQNRMLDLLKEDERRQKISEQLENTKREYDCQSTLLIGYLDTIVILGEFPEMTLHTLEEIRNQFPVSDYLACCFNEKMLCSPILV